MTVHDWLGVLLFGGIGSAPFVVLGVLAWLDYRGIDVLSDRD